MSGFKRIAVMGADGMGTLLGARLAQAGIRAVHLYEQQINESFE